ncbi:hypothetical protein AB3S75_044010 [Citrus x aurantiifolia]
MVLFSKNGSITAGCITSTSEQEIHPENSDDASLISDADGIYYRDYKSVDCGRQKEGYMFLVTLKEKISHIIGKQDLPLATVVKGIGDGHRNYQSLNFQSYGECYTAKQGRWFDTRSSIGEDHAVFDTGLPERHWSHIYGQDNGWDEIYDNTDGTNERYW